MWLLRREAGLTQIQLTAALDVPQLGLTLCDQAPEWMICALPRSAILPASRRSYSAVWGELYS